MQRRPNAGRAIGKLARFCLGAGDEFAQVSHRQVWVHRQDLRHGNHHADRRQIAQSIKGHLLRQMRLHGEHTRTGKADGQPIRPRPRHRFNTNQATATRAIFHNDRLAKLVAHDTRNEPPDDIRRSTRRKRHNQPYRLIRKCLSKCRHGQGRHQAKRASAGEFHHLASNFVVQESINYGRHAAHRINHPPR